MPSTNFIRYIPKLTAAKIWGAARKCKLQKIKLLIILNFAVSQYKMKQIVLIIIGLICSPVYSQNQLPC
jgi:hypothetical protein